MVSSKSSSSSSVLPEHLVEAILVKLPVESLVRFKLLSKNFRDLIDTPRFVAAHLQEASSSHQNRSTVLLAVHDNSHGIRQDTILTLTEVENGGGFVHHKEEPLPMNFASDEQLGGDVHYIDLLGSHNGLICLCLHHTMVRSNNNYYNNKKIVLWNPATKQSRILPPSTPPSLSSRVCGVVDLGFSYNHETDDYTVSGIIGLINDDTATNNHIMCYQVDVFSMRDWKWETYIFDQELASNIPPNGCISSLGPSHSVALKGIIYRVVSVFADETCHNFILSMYMKKKDNIAFDRIEFPETDDCWVSNLMVYGEGPSLGLFSNVGREEDGLVCFKCNVWGLIDHDDKNGCGSWRKLFTISVNHPSSIDHPMGSWGDGRIIIRRTVAREGNSSRPQRRRIVGNDLLVYDHNKSGKGMMRDLPIGLTGFVSLNACSYFETLVSLQHP